MKSNLAKGTLYLSLASGVFLISGYVINVWLGRYLGPETYGIFGIIISLVTVINLTQTAGLPQAVSKYVSSYPEKSEAIYKTGLSLQIISTSLVSLLFFIFSGTLAYLLKDPTLTPYLQLAAVIFPFYGLFALLTGYYNGLHQFGKQAYIHIIYSIVKIITIVVLAFFFNLYGVVLGFILSPLISLLAKFHLPQKTEIWFPYKKLILFSLPLIAVAICTNLLQSIDLFFIKALLHSDKITGFYTANQNIAEIPFFALTALSSVLFPSISRHISQNQHDQAKNLITKALRFCLIILMPSVFIISATSGEILSFLFSSAYAPGAQSLSILVIGSGFFTLFIMLTTIISSSGSPKKSAVLAGIGVIIASLLSPLLIPSLALNGAALATTIAAGSMMITAAGIVYRKFGVLFSLKSVTKIFIASFIIFLLAKFFVVPIILLPLLYLILFGLYCIILLFLKEITRDDVMTVRSLLPEKIRSKLNI